MLCLHCVCEKKNQQKLKTIRHPSVLRFIDCKAATAGVHLITERVIPLTVDYLEEIAEDEILLGLYDIMVSSKVTVGLTH